jgi:hypothetical protein
LGKTPDFKVQRSDMYLYTFVVHIKKVADKENFHFVNPVLRSRSRIIWSELEPEP